MLRPNRTKPLVWMACVEASSPAAHARLPTRPQLSSTSLIQIAVVSRITGLYLWRLVNNLHHGRSFGLRPQQVRFSEDIQNLWKDMCRGPDNIMVKHHTGLTKGRLRDEWLDTAYFATHLLRPTALTKPLTYPVEATPVTTRTKR